MQETRDTEGFARLREQCDRDPHGSAQGGAQILHRGAVIIGAKGGLLRQITVGDVLELLDVEASAHAKPMANGSGFSRILHRMGGADQPAQGRPAPQVPHGRPRPGTAPVLPVLVRAIDERRKNAKALLQAARQAHPGETFTAAGQTLTRSVTTSRHRELIRQHTCPAARSSREVSTWICGVPLPFAGTRR